MAIAQYSAQYSAENPPTKVTSSSQNIGDSRGENGTSFISSVKLVDFGVATGGAACGGVVGGCGATVVVGVAVILPPDSGLHCGRSLGSVTCYPVSMVIRTICWYCGGKEKNYRSDVR